MSKKVTAVTNAVDVEGSALCLATDGTIRNVSSVTSKGYDVTDDDVAITRQGLQAVKRAAVILLEIERLKSQLEKIKPGAEGDLGEILFENDQVPCIRVGCTTVYPEDLPRYFKALGIGGIK